MIVIGQYLCNEYYSNTFLSNLFPPIIMPAEKERVIMIDIGKTYFLIQHAQKKEEVEELFVHPQS